MNDTSWLKLIAAIGAALCLSACVSTEPRLVAPHVNLSPQSVFSQQTTAADTMVDFGIDVSANESDSLENLEILPGVRIRRVDNNGSAAAANLKAGDIILAVNDVATNNPDTFVALLQTADAGETVNVKVRRDTTVFNTTLVGQTRTQATVEELYRTDPIMSRAGYRTVVVEADGQSLTGAKVMEVFNKSPLSPASIDIDHTIVTADDYAVESAQGLVNYFMSRDYGDKVMLQVVGNDNQLTATSLRLWDPGRRLTRLSLWPLFSYRSDLSASTTRFSLLDLWIVSLFKYHRQENEKNYRVLTLFEFGTGTGELIEGATSE